MSTREAAELLATELANTLTRAFPPGANVSHRYGDGRLSYAIDLPSGEQTRLIHLRFGTDWIDGYGRFTQTEKTEILSRVEGDIRRFLRDPKSTEWIATTAQLFG